MARKVCFLSTGPPKNVTPGDRDCVLFIFISPTPDSELDPWVNAHIHPHFLVPTFLRVRGTCKGQVPGWAHMHLSLGVMDRCMLKAQSGQCMFLCLWPCGPWVQAGIPVSVGARTHVCFLPSPISFSTLYISGHRDFSPHRWEVLLLGTKSKHGKSYSFSQEASFFSSPPSSFLLSSPHTFLFHISPLHLPGGSSSELSLCWDGHLGPLAAF